MKIHGPNQSELNPYRNHIQKQAETMKNHQKKDQLEISNEAKKLQQDKKPNTNRAKYVDDIKQTVDTGDYHVDHEKTAEKMIDFWSRHS